MNLPAGSRSPRPTNAWYNKVSEASQAYHRNKQRQSTGGMQEGRLNEYALPVRVKTEHATPIPTYGMTRWGGTAIKAASLTDGIPELILKTKGFASTTDPISVAIDYIKNGNYGAVQTLGVAWARCLGPIAVGDSVEPNSDHQGILAESSAVTSLGTLADEVEGIIPVFIGAIGGCVSSYDLRLLWNPTAATMSIDVKLNGVTEAISIALTDDETDVKTAIDAHSEFVADSVHCTATSAGGFPSSNILVTLPAGATITDHAATLTRRDGSPTPEFRVDICGCAQ